MTAENFQRTLVRELVYEGGKVDDPADPGGRTNKGITQAVYNTWRRRQGLGVRDVYLIADNEVSAIYKELYWDRISGDKLPAGLDIVVMDAAVNSGVGQAARWLQRALPEYAGQMDGDFGAKTVQAALDDTDNVALITKFCALRLGTLQRLRTYKRFGPGWHARIANVQKIGISWSEASTDDVTVMSVEHIDGHRKAVVPDNVIKPPISVAASHITTASSAVSAGVTQASTQLDPVKDALGELTWIKYGLAGLTCVAAVAGVVAMISQKASDAASAGTREATVNPDADAVGMPVPMNDNPAPPAAKAA